MGDRAQVRTTDALKDVRAALVEFQAAVEYALSGVNAEAQRMSQWLSHDRTTHWRAEVRRRTDEVEQAKAAIRRKQIIAAPEPASIVDERKALARAQRRLEVAQRKQAATRRWDAVWDREVTKCRGAWQSLSAALRRDIPLACARLDRMIQNLEEYAALAPPTTGGHAPGASAPDAAAAPEPGAPTPPTPPAPHDAEARP